MTDRQVRSWKFTDDESAPCSYCVQWRCSECGSTDSCDHDYDPEYAAEPYRPDGSLVPLIRRDTCPRCKQTLADYYADRT